MRTLASHRKNPFQDCFPSPPRGEKDHGFPSGNNQAHPEEVIGNNHAHFVALIFDFNSMHARKKKRSACMLVQRRDTKIITLCLTFFSNVVFVSRGKSAHALLFPCHFAYALLLLYSVGVSEVIDQSIGHARKINA